MPDDSVNLSAWALIVRRAASGDVEVLVQFDEAEEFYRLPGGRIEPGELGAEACVRELREEYELTVEAGPLVAVREAVRFGHVALIYRCRLSETKFESAIHSEEPGVRIAWRPLPVLAKAETAPARLLDLVGSAGVQHLVESR